MAEPTTKKTKKRIVKSTKLVDGIDTEIEIEVDDVETLQWPARETFRVMSEPAERIDGPDKVTGRARYTADVRLDGMLWGRWLGSKYPNAKVVDVDLSVAEAMPGVKVAMAVKEPGDMVRFHGDPVAAVAAATPELAEDAIRAIRVEYDVQPHATTPEQALAPNAPQARAKGKGNVSGKKEDGDKDKVAELLGQCDHVVELELKTQMKPHVCFETHGVVVDYRGGDEAMVHASTQGVFTVPEGAAKALDLTQSKVTVNTQHMGGGFGSKFGIGKEGEVACRLSKAAKAPVHMMLTRKDEYLAAGCRSGSIQRIKAGCTEDGKFVALGAEQIRLGGVGSGSQAAQPYVYHAPNVYRNSYAIHANIDGARAWRAPGNPQACFGIESVVDQLACACKMDPVAFRKKNLTGEESVAKYHEYLDRGAKAIGWHRRNETPGGAPGPRKRGLGVAVAAWRVPGTKVCEVDVIINKDGSVISRCGTQDLGTGTRTFMAQITAEDLGLKVSDIKVEIGLTTMGKSNASGGSMTAPSLAPAVKDAVWKARAELVARASGPLGCKPEEVKVEPGWFTNADGSKKLAWKQVAALVPPGGASFRGEWIDTLAGVGAHPVQFAEVEVDTETGRVKVLKIVAVQNCGLCLNPLTAESQVHGGVTQSLSYGLLEERIDDPELGLMVNSNMEDYKIAGVKEIPEIVLLLAEDDDRPVIGVGEPPVIPTQSAIANAVYNACGVRITSLPITPDKVLDGLAALDKEGRRA